MSRKGLRLPKPSEMDRSICLDLAQKAEQQNFETLWIGESWDRNSVILMTQVLDCTDNIDIGSGIFNIFSRTPALIAMTAAGLDDISEGRVRIGLGTSGPKVIEKFHGVSYNDPLRRKREYIEIIRLLLDGEEANYDGKHFDVSSFKLNPSKAYSIPIYTAAMGEVNLRLTGEFADGWIPLLVPHHGLSAALEDIKSSAEQNDRSMEEIDVAPWIPTCISREEPDLAKDSIRTMISFYIGSMGEYYKQAVGKFGYEDEANRIYDIWNSGDHSSASDQVTDEMLSTFSICGSPKEAEKAFERYVDAGADMLVAYVPSNWATNTLIQETIRYF